MPPPQRRVIHSCPVVVLVEGAATKALGLPFFSVVLQLVGAGVKRQVVNALAKGVIGVDLLYGGGGKG